MSGDPRIVLQSGAVPLRAGEVLLVTAHAGGLTIPKGHIEPWLTPAESAANEAYEEAGVEGTIRDPAIGSYDYEKWGSIHRVQVFVMDVTRVHAEWPEIAERERLWLPLPEAAARANQPGLREILGRLRA